jgi:hypothetical protein
MAAARRMHNAEAGLINGHDAAFGKCWCRIEAEGAIRARTKEGVR